MALIGALYYISGIFAIIRLVYSIKDFSKICYLKEWSFRFHALTGKRPGIKEHHDKKDADLLAAHQALDIFEWMWVAAGLFSGNYGIFLSLIILGISTRYVTSHISYGIFYKLIVFSFILFRFLLYLALISNHFFGHGMIFKTFGLW